MSKNVKFLRKGVLFLAVLAMVLGQCFGVFGAVAEAATADDYKVTAIAWDGTVPATIVKGVKTTVNATVELQARVNTAAGKVEDLVKLALSSNGVDYFVLETLDVDVPATYKGDKVTVTFPVTIPAEVVGEWSIKLEADKVDNYKPETAAQAYEVTDGPDAFDLPVAPYSTDSDDDATKVYVTYADKITGQKISTPNAVNFGEDLVKTHGIFITKIDANNEHLIVPVTETLTVKNTNTGVTFNVDVVDGVAEVEDIIVNSANFDAGVNTLLITNDLGLARTYMTVIVNPETPTVDFYGEDAQLLWDEVTEGQKPIEINIGSYRNNDDRQKVLLVADVTADWFDFAGQGDATIRANDPATLDGVVEFYDNGKLVGTVKLGDIDDQIPVTTNHREEKSWGGEDITVSADQAAITFIVEDAGTHVYSAKFIPANEAAKVLTEAASNELDATYAVFDPNEVVLTISDEVVLRNDTVTFTLTFEEAPGNGEASFYLYNNYSARDEVNTLHFELNDKDTVYTDTQKLTELGIYDIECLHGFGWGQSSNCPFYIGDTGVTFTMDEAVYPFGVDASYTALPEKKDYFCLSLNNENIFVAEEYTYTTITAEPAYVYFGEDIVLTAKTVDENGDPMVVGALKLYAIDSDGDWNYIDEVDLADVKADENPKDWGTFTYTVEDLKDWDIVGFGAYYTGTSNYYYAPSEAEVAAGLIHQEGELKVIEKFATINNQDATDDLAWFKVALIDAATGEIATDVSTGEVRVSFADGYNTDDVDEFKGYITDGIATIYVENEVLEDLEMGEHVLQFSLYDCSYVAADIKDTLTIIDYELIPTNLKVFYDEDDQEITVQVWDEILSGRLYQARGYVTIWVGDDRLSAEAFTVLADGSVTAEIPVIGLEPGEDLEIKAVYSGDKKYAGSEAVCADTVDIALPFTNLTDDKLFEATAVENEITIKFVNYDFEVLEVQQVPALMAALDAIAELLGNDAWTEAAFELYAGDKLLETIEILPGELNNVYETVIEAAMGFEGEQEITVSLVTNFGFAQDEVVTVVIPEFKTTGWYQADNGDWYLFDENGEMLTGWQKSGAYWYYMDEETGIMATGFQTLTWGESEDIYYFDPVNGNMKTGWQKIDGEWYLFNASGEELFGWQKMGGAWYFLDEETGIMLTGFQTLEWEGVEGLYYLNALNGNMQTGWIDVDGTWYYAYANGIIATNVTFGNWTAGDDGIFTEIA